MCTTNKRKVASTSPYRWALKWRRLLATASSICPEITCNYCWAGGTPLLYLGAKQAGKNATLKIWCSLLTHYHARCTESGCVELSQYEIEVYPAGANVSDYQPPGAVLSHHWIEHKARWLRNSRGLQAMLANRMKYQRGFHGYDIFHINPRSEYQWRGVYWTGSTLLGSNWASFWLKINKFRNKTRSQ